MAIYLIGDVQGCDAALGRWLDTVAFSPSRDTLVLLGDLVNRGPDSLAVLRRMLALAASGEALLGNHDLSLLALAHGQRQPHPGDTLEPVLAASDRDALLDWLRWRPLALQREGWLLVHAGLVPEWTCSDALALAAEVQAQLRGADPGAFLAGMYGNQPARWSPALTGPDRWRVVINTLTRLRFVAPDGSLVLKPSGPPESAPPGCMPWFDHPGRRSAGQPIAFGHWSTLGLLQRPDLLALDTGCVWGGRLSGARLDNGRIAEIVWIRCPQARSPGSD